MANRFSDFLFQLIRSLEKSEKRHFKLYIKRSSAKADLKIIQVFDAIDRMKEYDENILLKKLSGIEKPQLSNIKAHLYKELLASLRLLKRTDNIDIELNEQLDYARILYYKGLYMQSVKILEKVKESAYHYHQDTILIQVISLEKKIESLHITRTIQDKADILAEEANAVQERRRTITQLSNLAMQLYSLYVKNGHARNEREEEYVKQFFREQLPPGSHELTNFYERLYLYQSYGWYSFIRQDFLMYYRYVQKWVDLFHEQPAMINAETGHYIKGLHNLLNAHFDLRNYKKFAQVLEHFENFSNSKIVQHHDNFKVQCFVYIYSAKLNQHLMTGTFRQGLKLVPFVKEKLEEYRIYLDKHRYLVFNYKVAILHFGSGDFDASIDYLQNIIHENVDLRSDLQCYARLVHLMAHYEMGNYMLIESLTKSVYRFMARMQNLTVVEEEMFKFLRASFHVSRHKLRQEFKNFLQKIKHLEKNRFETRAFAYLDIISWVESKLYEKTMSEVIHAKYLENKRAMEE